MGRWVVPDLTLCSENPLTASSFEGWIKSIRPDAVLFVDEMEEVLLEKTRRTGAAALACPAFVGYDRNRSQKLSSFDGVIAVSPWISEALKKEIPPGKIYPCDLGIDVDRFTPVGRQRKETVFLFDAGHGSVEDLENLLVVLTAFTMMNHEAAKQARLLIRTFVDWNLLPDEIRTRGEGQTNIEVMSGMMEDPFFLNMGDVLIHPRLSPGVHWIVPQAAACGVPSIVVDKSPSTGWIFDEHMILKVPYATSADEEGRTRTVDVKILADTLSTLASDKDMVDYMGSVCREKARHLLDDTERGRVLCDKITTLVTAWKAGDAPREEPDSSPWTADSLEADEIASETERLLQAIEEAIAEGKNEEAKELMTLYRHTLD
jgi:hypothetical protein